MNMITKLIMLGIAVVCAVTLAFILLDFVADKIKSASSKKINRIHFYVARDKDGFIYFKQRLKRLIVSSGYNIYPSYVEDIIDKHPMVDTCVVIGIPHEYKKQVAKAYIVLKNGEKATISIKKQIKKYCEDNLAKYSWPYEYEYRDSIPTTLVGKVAYKKLEDESKK